MKPQTLSSESTVYNYTLLHKIGSRHPLFALTAMMMASVGIFDALTYGWRGIAAFLAALFGLQLLYVLVIRLLSTITKSGLNAQWRWTIAQPWPGYLPRQAVPVSMMRRFYRHVLLAGLLAAGMLYIWVPSFVFANLLLLHLLSICPHVSCVRKFYRLRPDSVIRFNERDISCYKA